MAAGSPASEHWIPSSKYPTWYARWVTGTQCVQHTVALRQKHCDVALGTPRGEIVLSLPDLHMKEIVLLLNLRFPFVLASILVGQCSPGTPSIFHMLEWFY